MAIYRFSDDSAIPEIVFHHTAAEPPVALLAAREDLRAEQLAEIREKLEAHSWQCVAVTVDGRSALQVNGFANEKDCIDFLAEHRFIIGTPQIKMDAQDDAKPARFGGIKQFLKRHSLSLAGVLNLFGDIGLLWDGLVGKDASGKRDKYVITAGSLYTLGGANLALFGNRSAKPEQAVQVLSEKTAAFIKKINGSLPEDSGLAAIDSKVSTKPPSTESFLHRTAAQNTLLLYMGGAGAKLISGYKTFRKEHKKWGSLGYGISSVALKTISFFIPEQTKGSLEDGQESSAKKGPVRSFINWIKEKPLRLFGYGSMITEVMLAREAYEKYRDEKKGAGAYLILAGTTAAYILADLLVAISSKDPSNAAGSLNADGKLRVMALAAEVIAQQPEERREELMNQVTKFWADLPGVKDRQPKLKAMLQEQVENIPRNVWASRVVDDMALQLNR